MLQKTLITLTAVAALGVASTANTRTPRFVAKLVRLIHLTWRVVLRFLRLPRSQSQMRPDAPSVFYQTKCTEPFHALLEI